jgi:dTDP-4-amino-4,6-dideoxygalactose transaminase
VRTPRTKAVIAVHQGGVPPTPHALRKACAAGASAWSRTRPAPGSTAYGQPVGTGALIAAWSFHPRKLITTGEGGMVTVDDAEWAGRLRRLREHGMNVSAADRHASAQPVLEAYLETGYNYRMTDIQAAVGLVQLGRLDAMVAQRRELAARYHELLADVPAWSRCATRPRAEQLPVVLGAADPRTAVSRDEALAALAEGASPPGAASWPRTSSRRTRTSPRRPLPATERLTRDSLILPLFHTMTEAQQDRVVAALSEQARG